MLYEKGFESIFRWVQFRNSVSAIPKMWWVQFRKTTYFLVSAIPNTIFTIIPNLELSPKKGTYPLFYSRIRIDGECNSEIRIKISYF